MSHEKPKLGTHTSQKYGCCDNMKVCGNHAVFWHAKWLPDNFQKKPESLEVHLTFCINYYLFWIKLMHVPKCFTSNHLNINCCSRRNTNKPWLIKSNIISLFYYTQLQKLLFITKRIKQYKLPCVLMHVCWSHHFEWLTVLHLGKWDHIILHIGTKTFSPFVQVILYALLMWALDMKRTFPATSYSQTPLVPTL